MQSNSFRFYRDWSNSADLVSFSVRVDESDLLIQAKKNLKKKALKSLLKHRKKLEEYIARNPEFEYSLKPLPFDESAPKIVKWMLSASAKTATGPLSAVAGAIAEAVGMDLLVYSDEVIVENGGDIFIKTKKVRRVGIYAAESPFTKKVSIEIHPDDTPLGVCCSSGKIGHSLSKGAADAVIVLSPSTVLADAGATAIANFVRMDSDINESIKFGRKINGINGIVVIKGDKMGIWGKVRLGSI